jgi:NTE family protein
VSRHNALVLSGGGAFAAYEVGVLKALMTGATPFTRYRRIDPDIVTGTSAGSYNGALFVSRWAMDPAEAIAEIERIWLEEVATHACGNGVFRWRGNPLNFFDPACFLQNPARFFWLRIEDVAFFTRSIASRIGAFVRSTEPVEQRLLDLLNISNLISTAPFPELIRRTVDFEAIRRSDVKFQAITTNWRTGQLVEFENDDLNQERGPLIVMASSAIPGIFPAVDIPPNVYVDGGVLMNTPLAPSIHAGATHIHVVFLDPEIPRIPLTGQETTLSSMQRSLAISWAAVINRDIENVQATNRAIELWHEARRQAGGAPVGRRAVGRTSEVFAELESGRALRRIAIHRYRPRELLGGPLGMLNFSAEQTRGLIERGFHDAVNHDCAHEGCVLPEGGPDDPEEDR